MERSLPRDMDDSTAYGEESDSVPGHQVVFTRQKFTVAGPTQVGHTKPTALNGLLSSVN